MAATFGKMLLEKNEQLQHELQHLQKVAEETTLENQVRIIVMYHLATRVMNKISNPIRLLTNITKQLY